MHGFKSFARRTEIVFGKGINVILGPNGSGKSNVSDALCFVLGRLSIKSIRAAKAKNLLFMGSKFIKPSHEAYVELVLDNTDKAFSIDSDEIVIKRAVRHNGQGIYKINNETKTRAEVLETLAQAGIDPYGFNLVLQGQIQGIVKMHPEERRKIIEEVAGIAIYESRKEKSLHELEKTDEKLKEINAILRERSAYLKNLDRERSQALRFKELENTAKRAKASIISRRLDDKKKELEAVLHSIQEKMNQKDKIRNNIDKIQKEIESITQNIDQINKNIQKATGIEQETLHTNIANVKAELEGLKVRKENYENKASDVGRRIDEMKKSIPDMEAEIGDLKRQSPITAKKSNELKKKKDELAVFEEEQKKAISIKSELNSLRDRIREKERQIARITAQSESLLKQLEEHSINLVHKNDAECIKFIESTRHKLNSKREEIEHLNKHELENEKIMSVSESDIARIDKIKSSVKELDICPLCQSKITPEHIDHVINDTNEKIKNAESSLEKAKHELGIVKEKKIREINEIKKLESEIRNSENELSRHRANKEKNDMLKRVVEEEKAAKDEMKSFDDKIKNLENKLSTLSNAEEKYYAKMLEIEEISSRREEDVDTALLYKERELENVRNIIKRSSEDLKEIESQTARISESIEMKSEDLEKKDKQERELNERFKKLFEERDSLQRKMQEKNLSLSEVQENTRQLEDQINYLKIGKAKIDAEKEAFEMELFEFAGIEIIKASMNVLEEKLHKAKEELSQIGSINMRALEVYDNIKKEYDIVQEKVDTLQKEKEEIMKIIEEIDNKKTKTFMRNFRALNELFSQNFSQLYTKGVAFLELENKEDIFAGGVNIVVKLAKGKYFDVTSLSGGEQSLVALSLLFAIQEYKPYHFYILDEIDAALDKRNSERLSGLLSKYIKEGQYIIITHNDAIILNSDVLYGVSMHEGVSKILSMKMK